jgi:basic amino acid/polyamine antiporter, APA family
VQPVAEAQIPTDERRGHLLRVLGVVFGMAVTIGITIGMGILRTPGEVAAQLPNVWLFLGVWVLGGVYALLGTFSVAELGTMLPFSGGFYVYARRALGEYAGFVVGWSDWLSTCGTAAAVALVVGEYAGTLVPALAGKETLVSSLAVVFFAVLQWRGVLWGSRSQELMSFLKTLAFFALIAVCLAFGGTHPSELPKSPTDLHVATGLSFVGALVVALQGIIYTYDGWYSTVYFGEEVRDSARSIPRAMIGSVLLVIAIYLLFNIALVRVLPIEELAGQKLAAGAAAARVFGARGDVVIGWIAILSLLAAVNANTLAAPRIVYAMSRNGLFWSGASRVNEGGTPTGALFMSTVVAVLMIVFSGAIQTVLAALAFFFVFNYSTAFLSVFILRRREPDTLRPYRAWGYPVTTALALACSLAFLAGAVASDTRNSLYALGLLGLSYPAYLLIRRRTRVS